MRRFLALFVVLLGCLFTAQSTLAATAGYGDCCLHGCKGMTHCAAPGCQACAAGAVLSMEPATMPGFLPSSQQWTDQGVSLLGGWVEEIWHPPDGFPSAYPNIFD